MGTAVARALSLGIAAVYAVVLVIDVVSGAKSTAEALVRSLQWCVIVLIPVALIWFPEQIGSATGFIGHGNITAETPPILVSVMGWLFLVGVPIVVYFLCR